MGTIKAAGVNTGIVAVGFASSFANYRGHWIIGMELFWVLIGLALYKFRRAAPPVAERNSQ